MLKCLFGLFAYGVFVAEDHHLGQVADGAVVLERHGASRGLLQAGKDLEQGRLARAVLSDERDAVFFVYNKRHVRKERTCAEFNTEIFYRKHG